MVRPERCNICLPILNTIVKVREEEEEEVLDKDVVDIDNNDVESDDEPVDPDDAEQEAPKPGWEWNEDDSNDVECHNSGIGFKLKKATQSDSNTPPNNSNTDGDKYNYYPVSRDTNEVNNEMEQYNNGEFPMARKGCALGWWKPQAVQNS
ncbi:hypothetical protein PtA15_5A764 [Puccinia triticina]|uniref:Uncharacterized protein n=1 Tax=Puccinia triticina TaxID=208348 RepID=A0ABY7CN18_9BASI|nr:uncharacterized protein PtA15_5A764 [Puccinia triticina]WAQ85190.1 hypothetical protein PtA15_5A764 [Puccinia triticina]